MHKKVKNSRCYIRLRYLKNEINNYFRNIKYIYKNDKQLQKAYVSTQKTMYIFLAADYGNLGDIAITYAQHNFLEENFPEYSIIEVPMNRTYATIHIIKKHIKKQDVITIVGGGNMTDMYDGIEEMRRKIIKTFKKNKIVCFPQTMSFSNTNLGKESLIRTIKIYNNHKKLYIMARENMSYNLMKKYFKNVYLAPDIVFYLKNKVEKENKNGKIALCFRKDNEINEKFINKKNNIISAINKNKITFFDTYIGDKNITWENRYDKLLETLRKISSYDLVITDRLHGMIFSYVMGTNCIAIDNSNHKIKSTYNTWLESDSSILLSENNHEDIKSILKNSSNRIENNKNEEKINEEFDKLKDVILKIIKK